MSLSAPADEVAARVVGGRDTRIILTQGETWDRRLRDTQDIPPRHPNLRTLSGSR